MTEKSRKVSFLLTLLFGPLGLLYASPVAAIILIVVAGVTVLTVFGPIVCWLLAIGIGDHCVYKHNQSVKELRQAISAGRS